MNRNKQNPGTIARPGSAFHFFLMDRRENLSRQGVRVDSIKEFEAEAFSAWNQLSDKEPEKLKKYVDKHNEWERKKKTSKLGNKCDQSGRSLEQIKEDDQIKTEKKMEQKQFVETSVKNLESKGHLTKNNFFIVHFNTTTPPSGTQEGKHYPCEIGLVRYSIQNGQDKSLHKFLSPKQIPFGYRFEAMKKSKETHNIPPDPNEFSKYEEDYIQIFESIKKFMSSNKFEEAILMVYVMPNHEDAAKSIFEFICEKAGQSEKTFKICLLPQLLFEVMNVAPGGKSADGEKIPIDSIWTATKHLDKDSFKYWPELGCNFHEELGTNTHYCALTIARCLAFNMAQICSKAFNVRMQPGCHTPPENLDRSSPPSRVSTEIVKQAVTQETKNSWGTKISVQAAPAGISPIPTGFDPNQVTLGPDAGMFPGLHPELDERRRSQVEDFSFGHPDSFFQSGNSHRGSLFNSSCDDFECAKSMDNFRSSIDYNNQTRHEVTHGLSAFHGKSAVGGIRPIPEGENNKENRKVKKEGIQACNVGGQKPVNRKERASLKFEIKTIKQEKDLNTDMKNKISDNVDFFVRKDLKNNGSHNIGMDNKTKHVERPKTSNGVRIESSRARLSKDENVRNFIIENNYAETGGREFIDSVLERGSRGLNDAVQSTVGKCEKVAQKIGEVRGERGRGSVLTCLGNTDNLTVGKIALKISGKENISTVENLSVTTGLDDDVNTIAGKCGKIVEEISRVGRGRGNVKVIRKGSATNRK